MNDKVTKIAINGCGRIGRLFLKMAIKDPSFNIVAVNDLADVKNMAYLLKYDSVYGKSDLSVEAEDGSENFLSVNGKKIKYLSIKDPNELPWREMDIDVVIESTGLFASYEKSKAHLSSGAKKVLITAPVKDEPDGIVGATTLLGVNNEISKKCDIVSNASCTTNASSPIIAILDEKIGVEKAMLNTIHAYTASQNLVDGPNKKDWREGRAGAQNIVPSSTGAAIAVTKAFKELEGRFDGISIRVPVVAGSIADITFIAKKKTTAEEINQALEDASKEERWQGVFSVTKEPLTSRDIIGNTFASIADLSFTRVVGDSSTEIGMGNLVKVLAWYDNESGYTSTLIGQIKNMTL